MYGSGEGSEIINTTIVKNTDYGITKVSSGGNPTITNCIIWDNGDDLNNCSAMYSCIEDGDAGEGNISSDPCFVDAANDDYHLQSVSPCINAGDPNYESASGETDIDGINRIIGGTIDMGADEVCYFAEEHDDYDDWVTFGKPECWCNPRQCHGDANNRKEYNDGWYYVGDLDLEILQAGWRVKEPPKGSGILSVPNGICADFNHTKEGSKFVGWYRVGVGDLTILSQYWLVKEPPKGSGVPADCPD